MKKTDDDPVICSFEQEIYLKVPEFLIPVAQKGLNLAWLGTENCNKLVDGKYVSAIEDEELDKKIDNVHFELHKTETIKVTVQIHKSGRKTLSHG